MDYKILAIKNFKFYLTSQLKNGNGWNISNISKCQPHQFLNGGVDELNDRMFDCSDYHIVNICTAEQFKSYLSSLKRLVSDNPLSDALNVTNTITGDSIADMVEWLESNLEIIFQDYLVRPYFLKERDFKLFKYIHLQVMELLRFSGESGLIQFNTTATNEITVK